MLSFAQPSRSLSVHSLTLHRRPIPAWKSLSRRPPVLGSPCACGGECPRCRGETHFQPKLAISEPGDGFEQEADRVADQVMRTPDPRVHASPALPSVQRKCAACEEQEKSELQTKPHDSDAGPTTATAPAIVHEVLRAPGEPLDAETRAFMEPRFGQDFSRVRVHVDDKAAESAQQVNALAYTIGQHVIFGARKYQPDAPAGRRLLAHELTHVVQQRYAEHYLQRKIMIGADPLIVDKEYENIVKDLFGDTGLDILLTMDNNGKPPVYSFKGWEEFVMELRVRSRAVKAIEKTAKTAHGCCSFPDMDHKGGRLDETFWDKKGEFHFEAKSPLPPGKEASDAIEALFEPDAHTMLECYTMAEAVEYLALLGALGKDKFNKTFAGGVGLVIEPGRTVNAAGEITKFVVKGGTGPASETLEEQGKLELKFNVPMAELIPGDWVYFANFKDYLAKHPGGVFQGENAFYLGNGKFRGLGIDELNEDELLQALVDNYNEGLPQWQQKSKQALINEGGGFKGKVFRPVAGEIAP